MKCIRKLFALKELYMKEFYIALSLIYKSFIFLKECNISE